MAGEFGMLQSLLEKFAIADEHVRPSFDQSFQLFVSISEEPNDPVDPDQVTAEIIPPITELSPPFIAFWTALLKTRSRTRSNGDNWPTCRFPV